MPHIGTMIGDMEFFIPLIPSGDVLFHYNINSTTVFDHRHEDIVTGVSGTDTVNWLMNWSIEVTSIDSGTSLQVMKMMPADAYNALLSLTRDTSTAKWKMNNTTDAKHSIWRNRTGDELARMRVGNLAGVIRFHYFDVWIWK